MRENEIDALPLSASEAVTDADAGTDVVTVMLTLEDAIWEVEAVDERDVVDERDELTVRPTAVDCVTLLDRLLLDDSEAVDNALTLVDWDPVAARDSASDALLLALIEVANEDTDTDAESDGVGECDGDLVRLVDAAATESEALVEAEVVTLDDTTLAEALTDVVPTGLVDGVGNGDMDLD